MQERLKQILEESKRQLQGAVSVQDAEDVRVKVLGKKGQLTEILRSMGQLAPEERKELGQAANQVRSEVEKMLEETFENLKENIALIIGNEGNGICRELIEGSDLKIKIPMHGNIESLNASVAAGILMYEAVRPQ